MKPHECAGRVVGACLVASLGMTTGDLQARMGAAEASSQGPHSGRWARAQTHGAVFLQTDGVIDLAAPTPDALGFVLLVRGSSNGFFVLQTVGGAERVPLVYRNGRWAPVGEADLPWIEEMVAPLSHKLGASAAHLSIRGENVATANRAEEGGDWSGSTKSGFPALSMDSGSGIVQASWLEAGRRYGVYGVMKDASDRRLHPPAAVGDFRQFVGFAWDPATRGLDVVSPDSYTVSGTVRPSQEGDDLRARLVAGVAALMTRTNSSR